MALRNYLYAKHANDQFALSLMHKKDVNKDIHLDHTKVEETSLNNEIEDSHKQCQNCKDCKDCKSNKPKISIELEEEVKEIESNMREVDFTHKI